MLGIIGGSGFVGTRLSRRFESNGLHYKAFDICSKHEDVVSLDVEDPISLNAIREMDVLFNLAAVHRDDVKPLSRYSDVNVQGAHNVCDAARKYRIQKIIFTSSVAIYGFAQADTDESGQPNYFNEYGRTKFLAEQVYREWQAEEPESRTLVIVRPTVIFGEGNRGNVYNLLKQIASGKFVMFGSGENRKSMAYVENVAAFLEFSLSLKAGLHVYNYIDKPDLDMNGLVGKTREILYGKSGVGMRLPAILGLSIGYLADVVQRVTGLSIPVSAIRMKKFLSTTQFASSINETGFVPPVNLEDALAQTIRYEFLEDNSEKRTFETE